MNITKIPRYMKKVYELGPTAAIKIVSSKMHSSLFEQYNRYQVERKKAAHNWSFIASKYHIKDFSTYLKIVQKRSFVFSKDLYKEQLADTEQLMRDADAIAHNCFDILGSRDQCLITMPWHGDFRLRYQNPDSDYLFDKKLYYKDIKPSQGLTERLVKDIKVPWELSRFCYFFVLGAAYEKGKNPLYAKAFVAYVEDWIAENSFLQGPNWVCPMDVGIRAFNWVWAFHFFRNAEGIQESFWEKYIASLYDHLVYLENNWEVFEHTSNHYLGDLIGYYALTWFFADLKGMQAKAQWCHKELLKEFEKQVFDEGADYEGSTSYHRLVTEIFYHSWLLAQEHGHSTPVSFTHKLAKMFDFIDWCTTSKGYFVTIGDDDSGKLTQYGITRELFESERSEKLRSSSEILTPSAEDDTEIFFKEFGLAIKKDATWHVTLRHLAYNTTQPSGHFHNDVGSITVAVNGIPVIVDPGSYVYTPSAIWRNRFRSIEAHNSFYIEGVEPVMFDERSLFTLVLPEKAVAQDPWSVVHDLYSIEAKRVVTFSEDNRSCVLEDSWKERSDTLQISCWNFTLAPSIAPQLQDGTWFLFHEGLPIATVQSSDLDLSVEQGWYAPGYGQKVSCKRLFARMQLSNQPVRIVITAL